MTARRRLRCGSPWTTLRATRRKTAPGRRGGGGGGGGGGGAGGGGGGGQGPRGRGAPAAKVARPRRGAARARSGRAAGGQRLAMPAPAKRGEPLRRIAETLSRLI